MEKTNCCVCQKPKATLECGICHEGVCKKCAQFSDVESFKYLISVPETLSKGVYCGPCFDSVFAPALDEYNQQLELAKNLPVYMDDQGKETRLVKRKELPILVQNCTDKEEALLKLALKTVQMNYTALVNVGLSSEKVRVGTYQTLSWKGTGIPVHLDRKK